jgi:hypothetical protein
VRKALLWREAPPAAGNALFQVAVYERFQSVCKEEVWDSMSKTCWTSLAQRIAMVLVIAVAFLTIKTAVQPTTVDAAGTYAPSIGNCGIYAAQHLASAFWRDPVSGTALTANLFGYYEGGHFCGALYAEADLTLPATYDAEWVCVDLHAGGNGACGGLGPGPATGQQTFALDSPDRVEDCDGVDVSIGGFFNAVISIPTICGSGGAADSKR